MRPKEEGWYLVYGIDELDLHDYIEEPQYQYFLAQNFRGEWTSCCGKTIVNISYKESLF